MAGKADCLILLDRRIDHSTPERQRSDDDIDETRGHYLLWLSMVAWALPARTPVARYDRWCWLWWSACVHLAEPGCGGRGYRRSLWRKGSGTSFLDDPQR